MGANRNRRERLAGQLRAVISECLLFEVKDPGLRDLNITDVVVSGDLSHAKIYYYSRGDHAEILKLQRALERAQGFLRRRVGQEIRARVTPELVFYYDDSIERGAELERLLSEVKSQDEAFALQYRGDSKPLSELDEEEITRPIDEEVTSSPPSSEEQE
jgi:ribosome-binding factor A